MNLREIADYLDREFDKFLALITDIRLREDIRTTAYFAGGCIYSLANDKPVKDFDFFLKSTEKIMKRLRALTLWRCKTEYALSYGKYQIVIKYSGEPDECVGQFDFRHNMHYYVPYSGRIQTANPSFSWLRTNRLIFNEQRARDIAGVALRVDKFVERGMTISERTRKRIEGRTSPKEKRSYQRKRRKNKSYY